MDIYQSLETVNNVLKDISNLRIKIKSFKTKSDQWGSIGISYPDDCHMILYAWSNDYLLVRESNNVNGKYDSFRCFGNIKIQTINCSPSTEISGWYYYI